MSALCDGRAGCVSPSAAILVDDRGERLVCAYNDPGLDPDPSWLPLGDVEPMPCGPGRRAVAGGCARRVDGGAHGVPTVFDGDIGPRDALIELAQLAAYVVYSQPGLALRPGRR